MEKKYVKPDVYVEHFEMSQSIATSCGYSGGGNFGTTNHDDAYNCVWDQGNFVFFTNGNSSCTYQVDISGTFEMNGVCYNNPSTGVSIFGS